MKSSDISAKYSWPSKEQKDEIQDSGVPEEEDILLLSCGPRPDVGRRSVFRSPGSSLEVALVCEDS